MANKNITLRFALDNVTRLLYLAEYVGSGPTSVGILYGKVYLDREITDLTFITVLGVFM